MRMASFSRGRKTMCARWRLWCGRERCESEFWNAKSELQRLRPAAGDDKDFAVPNATRACGTHDCVGHGVRSVVAHPNGNFNLGQESQTIFAACVAVKVALLPAVTLGFPNNARRYIQVGDGLQHRLGAK